MLFASRKNQKEFRYDLSLLFVVIFLCVFGLIMIYSTSYYTASVKMGSATYYLKRQLVFDIAGILMAVAVSLFPHRILKWGVWPAYGLSIVLMILTDFTKRFGKNVNGQTRWFRVTDSLSFQPAEIVKIAVILAVAWYLTAHRNEINKWKTFFAVLLITFIPGILVLIKNLSSGIVIFAIPMIMLFVVSTNRKRLLIVLGGGLALVILAVLSANLLIDAGILHAYQLKRVMVWLNPEAYAQEGGYQVLQGLYAIGSGGLFGKGLGNSTQKLGFVPEASNDMIFSILCEELGLFGAVCLIILYIFLLYRLMIIANEGPDLFSSLVVIGVMAHVSLQVILHIAVVTAVIPNTGITLPFISYGGTSSVFLMFEIGMALCVSHAKKGSRLHER